MNVRHMLFAAVAGAAIGMAATAEAQTLSSLGVLPGWTEMSAVDISADGATVIGMGLRRFDGPAAMAWCNRIAFPAEAQTRRQHILSTPTAP